MKSRYIIPLCVLFILLTGCWDQNLLVNYSLINGISLDLTNNDNILGTVRVLNIQSKGGGQYEIQDEQFQSTRPTFVGLESDINKMLPGKFDAKKAYVVLIGEEMAKRGIHPFLAAFYRPRESYITSKIVITKGKASDILGMEPQKSPIAFFLLQGLKSSEETTLIPEETLFTVWTKIVDSGQDVVLPYVEKIESKKMSIGGVVLFHGDKSSGISLPKEQSTLLLLLMDKFKKVSNMDLILVENSKPVSITFRTERLNRNLDLEIDESAQRIICKLNLKMDIQIRNYLEETNQKINIDQLNKDLSTELTKQAKEVTDTLLKANCDALGIGRRIASFHPELWKKMNWNEEYKNVQFEPDIKVNIIKTGHVF